ncbi:MAG: hypothetical protein IKD93_08910 [Firmicutes bacterium]|nr:hypothetical protein [Bacillota bacterium]
MIWSIVPEEVIFAARPAAAKPELISAYLGRRVLLRDGRITALLSTDPRDHLDARFRPGTSVSLPARRRQQRGGRGAV